MRRVVITGIGCTSPLGAGVQANLSALKSGRSGVVPISRFDASELSIRSKIKFFL